MPGAVVLQFSDMQVVGRGPHDRPPDRAEPTDDLLGALVSAEIDGTKLTDWDILGFVFVMIAGGNDTTGNLISHGVMLLDGDHGSRERLQDQGGQVGRVDAGQAPVALADRGAYCLDDDGVAHGTSS